MCAQACRYVGMCKRPKVCKPKLNYCRAVFSKALHA
uniref:Uncharacterized protein n=1 Tax=Rhizophora mucronata TaxID=61149 RepID=A0A2P2JT87_RHIMU